MDIALKETAFETLQNREQEEGFREASEIGSRFFHKGQSGQWRDILADNHLDKIESTLGETMREYGYGHEIRQDLG